jgi:regulator of protease activity HflC (stomatin/prohibitin superfamily)
LLIHLFVNIKPQNHQAMTFNQYLKSVNACKPNVEWAVNKTIEEVVATCHRGDWLLWLAKKCDIGLQPLTLVKGHCANTVRHLMNDERSIRAVDVAIAFGEGKATREELDAAHAASADAAATYPDAAAYAADAAYYAAAAHAAANAAAYAAAYAADAAYYAAAANRLQTADICRKYIGELIVEKVNQILQPNIKPQNP